MSVADGSDGPDHGSETRVVDARRTGTGSGTTAAPVPSAEAASGWLTPGVRGIGAASLLSDLGHEVPTTLLPAFLSTVLGAPAAALGLIEGLADGLSGLAKIIGGPFADEPGRRRSIAVGGYTVTAVLSAAIGLATAAWQVGVLRTGAWVARGLRTPARNALLADAVDRRAYGRAYGFERAMDNLGAVLGPLAALALVSLLDVRTAILVSVVPGLLAGLAIVYAIRHIRAVPLATPRPRRRVLDLPVRSLLRGHLRRAFLVVGAFEVGNVAATLLILRATEVFTAAGRADAAQLAVTLYVAYNLAGTLASVPFGRLGDARGFTAPLLAGFALFAGAYGAFALGPTDPLVLGAAFVAAGVGIGIVETGEHAIVASAAPPEARGSAFGLLAGAQSFGDFAASGIVGILWSLAGGTVAFAYAATWMLIALLLAAIVRPGR
ncbi:MAG: MFS transporter [Chloroflexota bacterium]|nr:MAG: MFS transporter [Chloroflexota bacterium]